MSCSPLSSNVSGLEQTVRFLPNKVGLFHLDAPSSQAGARNARVRRENRKQNQVPSEIFRLRQARISEDFHEESIVVDSCTGPADRAGVCTDSPSEQHSRSGHR